MSTTDFSQISDIAEKLDCMRNATDQEFEAPQSSSYERAYTRLQKAVYQFKTQPENSTKAQSMTNAIDTYQTAVEILIMKAQHLFEKVEDAGIDLSPLDEKFGAIIKEFK
jgi:hypothetical protein